MKWSYGAYRGQLVWDGCVGYQASDESSISLSAGCDLFMRYVTRTSAIEYEDIEAGKARLIERGERFGEISLKVEYLRFFSAVFHQAYKLQVIS